MSEPEAHAPWLQLDNQFCFALYALSRNVTAAYRPLLEPLGLTYPQYLAMLVLWEAQASEAGAAVPVKFLGERLLLDSGTLTPLLKRLEAAGLIERRRAAGDEREVHIHLTGAGRQLKERASPVPLQLLCNSGVAPERIMALQQELRGLLAAFRAAEQA